jgi:beta-galactosidase
LKITPDRPTLSAGKKDLSFLRIDVVDEKGNFVPDGAIDLEVTVSGAGVLAGLCSGDPASHEKENTPFIRTFSGSALAIVRSNSSCGEIKVSVKGSGVSSAETLLHAQMPQER